MWGPVPLVAETLWMRCLDKRFNFIQTVIRSSWRTCRCTFLMVCCLPKGQACLNGITSQSGSRAPETSERSKVPESILLNQSMPRFTGERDNSRRNRNACMSSVFLLGFSNYRFQPADEKGGTERGRGGVREYVTWLQSQWLSPLLLPLFWQTALSISQVFGSFFPLWQKSASFMSFVFRQFTHIGAKTPLTSTGDPSSHTAAPPLH